MQFMVEKLNFFSTLARVFMVICSLIRRVCANARKTDGTNDRRNPFYMVSEKLLPFHLKIVLLVCSNVVLEPAL